MLELVKIVGAIGWIVGFVSLFLLPPLGVLILVVALVISIYTATKTRQKRHEEIVQAASQAQRSAPPPRTPLSVSERLEELSRLKEQGVISEDEYESKRQEILDQI